MPLLDLPAHHEIDDKDAFIRHREIHPSPLPPWFAGTEIDSGVLSVISGGNGQVAGPPRPPVETLLGRLSSE
jgi:hypothetical protein